MLTKLRRLFSSISLCDYLQVSLLTSRLCELTSDELWSSWIHPRENTGPHAAHAFCPKQDFLTIVGRQVPSRLLLPVLVANALDMSSFMMSIDNRGLRISSTVLTELDWRLAWDRRYSWLPKRFFLRMVLRWIAEAFRWIINPLAIFANETWRCWAQLLLPWHDVSVLTLETKEENVFFPCVFTNKSMARAMMNFPWQTAKKEENQHSG